MNPQLPSWQTAGTFCYQVNISLSTDKQKSRILHYRPSDNEQIARNFKGKLCNKEGLLFDFFPELFYACFT